MQEFDERLIRCCCHSATPHCNPGWRARTESHTRHRLMRSLYAFAQLQPEAQVQCTQVQDGPQPQTPSPHPQAPGAQLHPSEQLVFVESFVFMVFSSMS